jgi:putative tryptophan/tyrosine transport system substrate-binding protein
MRRRDFIKAIASSTVAWPRAVLAQGQRRIPRVGVLWHAGNAEEEHPYYGDLIEGFRKLGYVEGRILLEHRYPNEIPELFTSMSAELVASKCDVLVGVGAAAPYVKKATATIPIVFMYVPDPIAANLVESIRRPGGNATGMSNFSSDLSAKRLQYLKEIVPSLSRIGLLINPTAKVSERYIEESKLAGTKLGVETEAFQVRALGELEAAFDAMIKAGMQAVVVNAESLFYQGKETIGKLALARRLPTCVWVREVLEAGSLVSYGTFQREIARRVAYFVDRILKGERPADIPVEQPTRFELAINLKIAKALGVTVPPTLLATATAVIE